MHKRKFTSTRFTSRTVTAALLAASAPALLSLSAQASPAEGRSGRQSASHRAMSAMFRSAPAVQPSLKGEPMRVGGRVTLTNGKPAANALVYITC